MADDVKQSDPVKASDSVKAPDGAQRITDASHFDSSNGGGKSQPATQTDGAHAEVAPAEVAPAQPIVKKMRWPFPLIWIIPLLALAAGGYYLSTFEHQRGPTVHITFSDGDGLSTEQTTIRCLGLPIGDVTAVHLSPNRDSVTVDVQLQKDCGDFARIGARFWMVRPEISLENVSGLGTVLSGPYIQATPGAGAFATEFRGFDKPPTLKPGDLSIVLQTNQLTHLQAKSGVYYRGIQVGEVQDVQLSEDGTHIDAPLVIYRHYVPLVRTDSQFWSVSGADIKGGIFSGVEVKLDSLRALVSGGVAFATPWNTSPLASEGETFPIADDAKKEWLQWSPSINLGPDDTQGDPSQRTEQPTSNNAAVNAAQSAMQQQPPK